MKKALLLAVALSVAGCGTDEHEQERQDARRWDELAHTLAASAAEYCAIRPWSQPSCAEAGAQHVEAARGFIDEVRIVAERVDAIAALGSRDLADGVCTGDALMAELDRHAAARCSGSESDAEAETLRHCTTVLDLTAQMHLRSDVALRSLTTVYHSGSGSRRRTHRTSAGTHDWPWAVGEQPGIVAICPAAS